MLEPPLDGPRPPLERLVFLRRLVPAAVLLGEGQQALRRVASPVQDHVFDGLAQLLVQRVVDGELARVHDAHGEAGVYGVVEEDGVDRLPHRVVAAEGERDVRDAARRTGVRQRRRYLAHRLDEVHPVVVVLLDTGGDGEDVGVEDDVLGRKADLLGQDLVGALADLDLALLRVRLALLVEGHHDHGGPVPPE